MTPTDDDNSLLIRDIKDSLEDIKYKDNLEDLDSLVEAGVKSPQFLTLVRFLVKEVTSLYSLEGHDDLQEADLDSEAGMMELSSFLRDLECPHTVLTEGPVTQRLEDKKARLILLDFLLAETMTARMTAVNKPDTKNLSITMSESPEAAALKKILLALGFPKPPENITPLQLWDKVTAKVQEQINKTPPEVLGKPLMSKQVLTEDQWSQVNTRLSLVNSDLNLTSHWAILISGPGHCGESECGLQLEAEDAADQDGRHHPVLHLVRQGQGARGGGELHVLIG